MFCSKCGSQVTEGERFCSVCGAQVEEENVGTQSVQEEGVQPQQVEETDKKSKPKKESRVKGEFYKKKGLVIAVSGAVAAVLLIVILCNAGRIGNFFSKTFSSPEKYYRNVEKQTVDDIAGLAGEIYSTYVLDALKLYDKSYSAEVSFEPGKTGISVLDDLGIDVSWFKAAKAAASVSLKNGILSGKMSLNADKNTLMSGELIIGMEDKEIYLLIPELCGTYIGADIKDLFGSYSARQFDEICDKLEENKELIAAMPDKKQLEKVISKYIMAALECVDDVSVDSKTIKADNVKQKCTQIEVTIDSGTLSDMLDVVKDTLEDDKDVQKILEAVIDVVDADIDADDIIEDISRELDYMKNDFDKGWYRDYEIVMKVYVDGKGNILGREIKIDDGAYDDDDVDISMLMTESGNKYGIEFSYEKWGDKVKIVGNGRKSGNSITGDFDIRYNGQTQGKFSVNDLDLGGLKKGYLNGTIKTTLTYDLARMLGLTYYGFSLRDDITLALTSKASSDSWSLSLSAADEDGDKYGTITASLKSGAGSKASVPSSKKAVMVEDMDDFEDWLDEVDWEAFITLLGKTALPSDYIDIIEEITDYIEDGYFEYLLDYIF